MTGTVEKKRTDLLKPGDKLEPLEFHVTREFNENYLHAVEDLHPRYQEATSAGPALVHTALLVNFSNLTRSPSFHLPDGVSAIYAHEKVEFVGLGRVGETFRVTWKVADTYERRARPYQVMEALVAGPGGTVLRRTSTYTFTGGAYPGIGAARSNPGLNMKTMAAKDIQPGDEVTGRSKYVTSYRTWLFSGGWPRFEGWPAKNVHTDLEFAQACGLETRVASGTMLEAYLAELAVDLFGESWLKRGRLELKFVRPVEVDDRIVAHGVVTSKQRDGAVHLDLQCENQHGEVACIGAGKGWTSQN